MISNVSSAFSGRREAICLIAVLIFILLTPCRSSGGKGVLRVRITNFQNPLNKDAEGNCCMNFRRAPSCEGSCRTFFRVCATHSPRPLVIFPENLRSPNETSSLSSLLAARELGRVSGLVVPPPRALKLKTRGRGPRRTRTRAMRSRGRGINPHVPCTLGLLVTEVVTNSSLDINKEGALEITFPFSTPWPINFKLILEAWHDVTGQLFKTQEALKIDERVGKLIMRHVGRHAVEAGENWSHYKYRPIHTQLHYSLRVSCASPYYGNKCSKSCEDLGDKNSHYICDDKGQIRCLAGWSGDRCDIPKCAEGCHPIHGFCTAPGECRCSLGWHGEKCTECTPLPGCQNGYCNSTSFECICHAGWEGLFCSQPTCRDGCHITRGYCERPGECKCRIGWGGPTCEECKPLPGCVHGNCTKPLECRCEPGWTGLFCQEPVCSDNCNKDHGSCTKPGECRCDVGWFGETCDRCFPYPGCKNGLCKNPWECICNPGWKGMLCDEPDDGAGNCINNPGACLNGGTCIDVPNTGNFTCSCPSLFTGQRCDYLAEFAIDSDFDPLEPTNSPSQIQIVTTDSNSSTGSFDLSLTGERPDRSKRPRNELTKDERRIILQNSARILFRQPKLVSKEKEEPESPSFKVIERKLLPLPVFLPRVSEIIPGDEGPTRILKSVTKQPTPILVLEPRSDSDNIVFKDSISQEPESPRRNQIDENRRFIRHQEGSPDFIPGVDDVPSTESARSPQSIIHPSNRIVKVSRLGDQSLEISAHATALPRPNPISPGTLRTRFIPVQQTGASSKHEAQPLNRTSALSTEKSVTIKVQNSSSTEKPAVPQAQSRSSEWLSSESLTEDDVIAEGSEGIQTYYEENSNGRVHIGDVRGVDDAAPHEEIYEAFIELKKV
ncbi:protein eyes shut-like isoform X1 [Macrobrachium nipponense]|uniref:protein eyes shut-like isoform X1 n=2 Tax=Macrobrachium nipponense TaxID=159736 RepID=UPI0030C7E166